VQIDPEVLKKLNEIQVMLGESSVSKYMVALIGLGGVIAGSAVTAFVQLRVAKKHAEVEYDKQKRQLLADLVAKERQQWLDTVRKTTVDFIESCDTQYNARTTSDIIDEKDAMIAGLKALSSAHLLELQLDVEDAHQKTALRAIKRLHASVIENLEHDEYKKKYIENLTTLKASIVELSKSVNLQISTILDTK